jgi:hypothetical protein
VSLGPLLLALVGVSALGGAVGLGLMAKETQDDYDKLPVLTTKQAEAARDKLDQGRLQALGANILFAVGGAALLGASVWLAVDLSSGGERTGELALMPELGPDHAGLAITGSWEQVVPPHTAAGRNLPTARRRTIRVLEQPVASSRAPMAVR